MIEKHEDVDAADGFADSAKEVKAVGRPCHCVPQVRMRRDALQVRSGVHLPFLPGKGGGAKMKQMKKVVFLTPKELAEKVRKRREYVPPRPVFKTAEWYARTSMVMCQENEGRPCRECPLGMNTDESGHLIPCRRFQRLYPAEAVKRVEAWWIENRERFPEYVRKDDR